MLVLGAGFGVGGNFWRKVHRQRRLVSILEEAGGHVQYGYEFGSGPEVDYSIDFDGPPTGMFYRDLPLEQAKPGILKDSRFETPLEYARFGTPPGPKFMRSIFGENVFATIEGIRVLGYDPPQPFDLEILQELPELRLVQLRGAQVTDESLQAVAQLPHLRRLSLSDSHSAGHATRLTRDSIRKLKQAKRLEVLELSGDWVTDETLGAVSDLTGLKALALSHTPNVTSKGIARLNSLERLQSLTIIRASQVDDEAIAHISGLSELKFLQLFDINSAGFNFERVGRLRKLEYLEVLNVAVAKTELRHLESLKCLKILKISNTSLGNEDLAGLEKLPLLRDLKLGGSAIGNEGLAVLGRIEQLESLCLEHSAVTDDGLPALNNLSKLRLFSVSPSVTSAGVQKLQAALPKCEVICTNAQGKPVTFPAQVSSGRE
jgi:Leucine-rich repeat (LRR) protein